MAVGLPGILIAAVVKFTLPEPQRGAIEARVDDTPQPPLGESLRYLFRLRAYRQIGIATSLYNVASYGFMFWVPQSARLGLGISILSYCGQVRIGVATDAGLVPDPEGVVTGIHQEFNAMLRLAHDSLRRTS